MGTTRIGVRDVDEKIFREFRAWAIENGMTLGEAITLAMQRYLKKQSTSAKMNNRKVY